MQLSVLPCLEYEIELFAELFNRESDKEAIVKEYILIILGLVLCMWPMPWLDIYVRSIF